MEAKKWPKSIPKITDRGIAIIVANMMIQKAFFHRSEKVDGKKGVLKVGYYCCHIVMIFYVFKNFVRYLKKMCLRMVDTILGCMLEIWYGLILLQWL
jgi:hypothetical protein